MAGAMLVLLAASRVPLLQPLLGREVLEAGNHLRSLLSDWSIYLNTPTSPSVIQSIRIIEDADKIIKQTYPEWRQENPDVEVEP